MLCSIDLFLGNGLGQSRTFVTDKGRNTSPDHRFKGGRKAEPTAYAVGATGSTEFSGLLYFFFDSHIKRFRPSRQRLRAALPEDRAVAARQVAGRGGYD